MSFPRKNLLNILLGKFSRCRTEGATLLPELHSTAYQSAKVVLINLKTGRGSLLLRRRDRRNRFVPNGSPRIARGRGH